MIGDDYLQSRAELGATLGELSTLAYELKAPEASLLTLQQLQQSLYQPFLFVVVGEVKAGKSSLLNALFGQIFCKVDVLPATDRIYVFKYGEEDRDVGINPRLTERYRAAEFLRDFNVVDTPGTNTIIAEHQTITEQFLPLADLVLFVFSATNPWAGSAWEFLQLISGKWLKQVVFVIQQADLRTPEEIESITRHLEQTTLERLGQACPIFAVSARQALEAKTHEGGVQADALEGSGFAKLERYINQEVAHGEARMGKLRSVCSTTGVLLEDLARKVRVGMEVVEQDSQRLNLVRASLETRRDQSRRQIGAVLYSLTQSYERAQRRGEELLAGRLSMWQTMKLIFNKGQWSHSFQQELEDTLRESIQRQIENSLELLETDLRGVWQQLHEELQSQFAGETRSALVLPDFAQRRNDLLRRLELTLLERGTARQIEEEMGKLFTETANWLRIPAGVAAAGGLATLVAALAHTAILDVTGTIAGVAAVLGTVVAVFKRQQILAEFRKQMVEKRNSVLTGIEDHLGHSIDRFYRELEATFEPLEVFCRTQRRLYEPMLERFKSLEQALARNAASFTLRKDEGA